MFGEAVDKLGEQDKLTIGRVNCYDWTDVCGQEDISVFPTLRFYKDGDFTEDYRGPQDIHTMYATLKL